jgi:hypothetical protein
MEWFPMRKLIFVITLIVFVLVAGTLVLAQDEEPSLCTDGTWYCPDPNDAAREEWNYACGWYWGHFNAGLTGSVPVWCVYPAGYCVVDRTPDLWSWDLIHFGGWDIWTGSGGIFGIGNFVGWVESNPGLPECEPVAVA